MKVEGIAQTTRTPFTFYCSAPTGGMEVVAFFTGERTDEHTLYCLIMKYAGEKCINLFLLPLFHLVLFFPCAPVQ